MKIQIGAVELDVDPRVALAFRALEDRAKSAESRADLAEHKADAYLRVVNYFKGLLGEASQAMDRLGATRDALRAERERRGLTFDGAAMMPIEEATPAQTD